MWGVWNWHLQTFGVRWWGLKVIGRKGSNLWEICKENYVGLEWYQFGEKLKWNLFSSLRFGEISTSWIEIAKSGWQAKGSNEHKQFKYFKSEKEGKVLFSAENWTIQISIWGIFLFSFNLYLSKAYYMCGIMLNQTCINSFEASEMIKVWKLLDKMWHGWF